MHVVLFLSGAPPSSNRLSSAINICYYQYARPDDNLPSVKPAILRAEREMRRAENEFAALILIGCRDDVK